MRLPPPPESPDSRLDAGARRNSMELQPAPPEKAQEDGRLAAVANAFFRFGELGEGELGPGSFLGSVEAGAPILAAENSHGEAGLFRSMVLRDGLLEFLVWKGWPSKAEQESRVTTNPG